MVERTTVLFSGGGTGGHLYPALALAGALRERRADVQAHFVGAERGIEARVLPGRGESHTLLPVQGFRRDSLLANTAPIRALVQALRTTAELFQRERPHLVVVTGGYAGGPAGILAALTRTPLVLQEQNSVPGLTTRVLSLFAREIHLAFPEAVEYLPAPARSRARVTGNPVAPPSPRPRKEAASAFGLSPQGPVVLVVGGSQGAQALNQAVLEAVTAVVRGRESLPADVQLLWATGPANEAAVQQALAELGSPGWVKVTGYIEEMPLALSLTDLSVSRAGAMATSEFLAWGIPSLLVPLPTAAADHQTQNARALEAGGAAECLPQGGLTGPGLWARVTRLLNDPQALQSMARAARGRGRPDAARAIAGALEALLPPAPLTRRAA